MATSAIKSEDHCTTRKTKDLDILLPSRRFHQSRRTTYYYTSEIHWTISNIFSMSTVRVDISQTNGRVDRTLPSLLQGHMAETAW